MLRIPEESITRSNALEIYAENVPYRDVARAYLEAEIPNILGNSISTEHGTLHDSLGLLSDDQIDRLLESLSYSYRMNGVFHTVTDTAHEWLDVELPIDAMTLTGTKPHINDIVYSDEIRNRPAAFAEYLADYFDKYPDAMEDPAGLDEFRPKTDLDQILSAKIITAERGGRIEMVDGIHRLVTSSILGAVSIRAYAATHNGKESLTMKGDSTFLTLRLQYESVSTDEAREHIFATCLLLARASTDGAKAIETYWIDHPMSTDIKDAGKRLLLALQD